MKLLDIASMAEGWPSRNRRGVLLWLTLAVIASGPIDARARLNTADPANHAVVPSCELSEQKLVNLEVSLRDLNGSPVKLSDFKGKVIVLNLWATWCGPCRKEIPDLVKLQAAYPKDVAVIGVVVLDKFGDKVALFVREFGITYPVLDGNDRQDFEDAFGPFWGLPTSFVIDRHGRLRKKHQGQATLRQLEREIGPLISD